VPSRRWLLAEAAEQLVVVIERVPAEQQAARQLDTLENARYLDATADDDRVEEALQTSRNYNPTKWENPTR
jgi:hypothetical protein